MKRRYPIYFIIFLQCAVFFALGAAIFGFKREAELQRECIIQPSSELNANREQAGSTDVEESCQPSSGAWTVHEDRKIVDYNVCFIERFERRLQQMTCAENGATTRQYNKVVSDWTFVGSRSC